MTNQQPPARGPRTVVVVDDEPSMLVLIGQWLTSLGGYEFELFTAFEPAKAHMLAHPPDLLVTDIRLGTFNGLQLVVVGKTLRPDMGAIVMTGYRDEVLHHDAMSVGASVYLLKPFDAAAFHTATIAALQHVIQAAP